MPILATALAEETPGPSVLNSIFPSLSMCATGGAFMLRNASRREVCIFLTRVPAWTANESSPRVSCITTNTPERFPFVQNLAHATRLLDASDEGLSEDLCAPTSTTGLGTSPSMNDRAAAVYPMVSVPWSQHHLVRQVRQPAAQRHGRVQQREAQDDPGIF